jgi:broad specificity phosphatase PhoE
VETAEPVAKRLGLPIHQVEALIDLDYGRWHGWTPERCEAEYPKDYRCYKKTPFEARPPDGESVLAMLERVVAGLTETGESFSRSAAISHEMPIRALAARLSGLDGADFWALELPTGSITTIDARRHRSSLCHLLSRRESNRLSGRLSRCNRGLPESVVTVPPPTPSLNRR